MAGEPIEGASLDETNEGEEEKENGGKGARRQYLKEAYARVPEIGRGQRWYDLPFRLLNGFAYSKLGRVLPRWVVRPFYFAIHWLYLLNDLDRERSWSTEDDLHNVHVPAEEHVHAAGLWAVDYFPPSCIDDLNAAIRRQGWDSRRPSGIPDELNSDLLSRSRRGAGPAWWRIATISPKASPSTTPRGVRQQLPAEFQSVELLGVKIGDGLTAVIAHFTLTDVATKSIDTVWHTPHDPRIVFRSRMPVLEDRMWTSFRKTQESRRRLHEVARGWLASNCPGAFANAKEQQPLMDLLLLEEHDPFEGLEASRRMADPLRALGVDDSALSRRTSGELPGLLLEHVSNALCPTLGGRRTWTLWGHRASIASSINHINAYGDSTDRAIGHVVHQRASDLFVRLGLSDFLQLLREQGAAARDNARSQHGKFGRGDLKRLRNQFLTSSLDITSMQRDLVSYNAKRRWLDREATFTLDLASWVRERDRLDGRESPQPVDVNGDLRTSQQEHAAELLEMDRDYRDVLSTVASLGASIHASKIQRYAVSVAMISLAVALLTTGLSLIERDFFTFPYWGSDIFERTGHITLPNAEQ